MIQLLLRLFFKPDPDFILSDNTVINNILIVRQHNQLGDMLCSLPLYYAIRKKYPAANVTLVASPTNYEILYSDINPVINEVLIYDKSTLKKIWEFYKKLRTKKYEIAFVPSTVSLSRTSHIIAYLSKAAKRIGVESIEEKVNKSRSLLNVRKAFLWEHKQMHQIERNLDIGRQIGCDLPESERSIKIELTKDEESFAKHFIASQFPDKSRMIAAFHPGAGKIPNRWPKEKFLELILRLYYEHNIYILITSGVIDEEITGYISLQLRNKAIEQYVLSNTPVRNVGAVLKRCDIYITNDTGTMHVAEGVNAKIIALFGPTNPYEWQPLNPASAVIKSPSSDISQITVDEVYTKAVEKLKS